MATNQNDNFNIRAPKPVDNRWGVVENGVFRPFNDTGEANELIQYRHRCLTVWILNDGIPADYWYRDGLEDEDLIEKEYGSSYTFENGLRDDSGVIKLGTNDLVNGLLTEPTVLIYSNGLNYSLLSIVSEEEIHIGKIIGGSGQRIWFHGAAHNNEIHVTDAVNQKGLEEPADYSANKTQYSYVTKKMLDEVAGEIPTLQEVTDEGSTTTNTITATGFNANNYADVKGTIRISSGGARITFEDDIQNYSHLNLHSNIVSRGGHISVLSAGTSGPPTYGGLSTDILTSSRIFTLPDKSGTVALLDDILTGPTYTSDPSTPNTAALSYLNSTYPNAKPGDQVYKVVSGMRRTWTCYAAGEWSRIDEVIEI